jgi:16S rRNA (cytosine967-C5)-methyltransferase
MMNLRTIAARIMMQVIKQGRSLSDCLPDALTSVKDPRDQALLQALCYGVCRRYFSLEALANALLEKPLKEKDTDIFALILVGLYQLTDMRIPAYAAVAETVAAVKDFKKLWAKGLINAVLRHYQRRADELQAMLTQQPSTQYAYPTWLIDRAREAWPTEWESILQAGNQHPPFALRVNRRRHTREQYQEKLTAREIASQIIAETSAGICLAEPRDVEDLPGFSEGEVSVQDGAAQLAAELLDLKPSLRVLDACAAPGGKTAHIAEQQDLKDLIAIDCDATRLQSVKDNLARLHLAATCLQGDAGDTNQWWDGQLFDRILLDAPCSATGVIRRHPDIKLLRRSDDIPKLIQAQWRLLTALWPLLKNNGILLYATCSILPEENSELLARFLSMHPDAKEDKIQGDWGMACEVGRQILPGQCGMDGFYYARLLKKDS